MRIRQLGVFVSLFAALVVGGCDSGDDSGDDKATGNEQSTGNEQGESETSAEPCADRPAYPELYSSCAGAATCGVSGLICATQTGMSAVSSQAFCTKSCYVDEDCPSVGECGATGICSSGGMGQGVCALDCADGKQCPDNMMCLSDLDPTNPRDFCF